MHGRKRWSESCVHTHTQAQTHKHSHQYITRAGKLSIALPSPKDPRQSPQLPHGENHPGAPTATSPRASSAPAALSTSGPSEEVLSC